MIKIFKVEFPHTSFELTDSYDKLSDIDKERISDLEALAFFDFDSDKGYEFFIIVDEFEFKSYSKILNENLISHRIMDISDKVLKGKIDIEADINKFISPMNTIRFSFFTEELNIWIYDNLDIDLVLDRISEVGMSKLRKVETNFLSNYSQEK